ncbi:MAG: glycerophosphodiester phosphodiesterase [Elusimicrobiales bacterium]|nr:glycerophosphodiester phosphodiesterase [Elusimicrobiales bacterium]
MKKILFLVIISLVPGLSAETGPIAVHGHRGSRGTAPENTIPAFKAALAAGADVLEMDMGVTKDNVIVISHEPRITPERCLGLGGEKLEKPVPLRSLTLAEVKKYDCGSLPNPRFPRQVPAPGARIPTLDEVFALVKASGYEAAGKVEFNIETKIFPAEPELSPSPAEFAKLVADAVRKNGMEKRVIVQSFDVRTLKEIKKIAPAIRTSQLTYEELVDIVPALKSAGADIWSPNGDWMTPESVREAQAAGIKVAPWTLNTPKEWDAAIAAGVDAIITDYPGELAAYLRSKKLR